MGNLSLPQVIATQNNKEVTINTATNDLDIAMTEVTTLDFTSGNVTATLAQMQQNQVLKAINGTVARTLTLVATKRYQVIWNTNTAVLTITLGTTNILCMANEVRVLYLDGTANGMWCVGAGMQQGQPYDVANFFGGTFPANAIAMQHVFARSVILKAGLTLSQAKATTAATGSTVFTLKQNGTALTGGTITFAASGTVGAFALTSDTTFNAGDYLSIIAPGTPDTTLANVSFTISGIR